MGEVLSKCCKFTLTPSEQTKDDNVKGLPEKVTATAEIQKNPKIYNSIIKFLPSQQALMLKNPN